MFYEYGGEPHKIYAAQAVMSGLLSPASQFVRKLRLGEFVRGYLFRSDQDIVAVVWAPGSGGHLRIALKDDRLRVLDIMGRQLSERKFRPAEAPFYILGEDVPGEDFEDFLAR